MQIKKSESIIIFIYNNKYNLHSWPSGLRRYVKAVFSSEARVRIPSQPIIIIKVYDYFIYNNNNNKYIKYIAMA